MFSKITKHPLLILSAIFLFFHVLNLTLLPIFGDEAIYLDWGWREVHEGIPYHSLYDGKQPFLMWIYGLLQTLPVDPLWICRLFSVFTGLITLIGIYFIAKNSFNSKIAFLSGLLYSFTPLFFFFDRQALMESSMSAVSVWTFYFLLRLYNRPRFLYAALSGAILGIGFFIKSTTLVFLAEFIFLYFLFLVIRRREPIRYINLFLIILSAFIIVNLPLFFQPSFWFTLPSSVRYSLSLSDLLKFPASLWLKNFLTSADITFFQLTFPILFTSIFGSVLLLRQKKFTYLCLLLWIVLSLTHTTFFARSVNSRYLAPYLPLAVIPAAFVLSSRRTLSIVTLITAGAICLLQIFNPPNYLRLISHFSGNSGIEGYVTGDSTGYQVLNTIKYFQDLSKTQKFIVGIALNVGNPESTLLIYLRNNPNITVTYIDSRLFGNSLKDIDCFSSEIPVYFMAREQQQAGLEKYFTPVTKITNTYNSDYHTIYTLKPDCTGNTLPLTLTKR